MRFPSGEMRTSEIDRRRIKSSIVTLAALAESAPQQIKVQKSKPSFLRILLRPGPGDPPSPNGATKQFRPCQNQGDWTQQTQQGKLDKRPGGEYIALVPRSGIFLSVIFVSDCSLIGFPWEHSRSEWGEAMNEPKGTGKSLSVILKFLAFEIGRASCRERV